MKNETYTSVSGLAKAFCIRLNRFSVLFSLSFWFSLHWQRLLSVRLLNNYFNVGYFDCSSLQHL